MNLLQESAAIMAAKKGDIGVMRLLGVVDVDQTAPDADGNTMAHYTAQVYSEKHILIYLRTLYWPGKRSAGDATVTSGFNFKYQNKQRAMHNTGNGDVEDLIDKNVREILIFLI